MRQLLTQACAWLLAAGLTVGVTQAQPAQSDIDAAIDAGVVWLANQQNGDGSFGTWEQIGKTGLALVKLQERAFEMGKSPFDPAYEYYFQVEHGLSYLFNQVDLCGPGPDFCFRNPGHETYSTGIAMMAVAAGRQPDRLVTTGLAAGMTYLEVLQSAVDYFAAAQKPDGGFGYEYVGDWSDNSNTGYATLGLYYAEGFGAIIPASLKANLSSYVDWIQNDVDGDANDGGSGYTDPWNWVNMLKTGNLLVETAFVGDLVTAQRVQDALDYLARTWSNPFPDPGFRPHHYQAMYNMMKGLQIHRVDLLPGGIDWFPEFAQIIIDTQLGDGSWPPDNWGDELLSTAWALLTLERLPTAPIAIDIKPGSFPNSINCGNPAEVIAVAILGSDDFDATRINYTTVQFGRFGYEAAEIHVNKKTGEPRMHLEDANYDGHLDLVFHFRFEHTGLTCDDEEGVLTGMTDGGLPVQGFDSIRMVPMDVAEKGNPTDVPETYELYANYPNPFNPQTTITFALPETGMVTLTVFDVLGRQIEVLVSGALEAGEHAVTFDATALPSGTYIYRLDTQGGTFTRAMFLLR